MSVKGTGMIINADDIAIDLVAEAERIRDVMGTALIDTATIDFTADDARTRSRRTSRTRPLRREAIRAPASRLTRRGARRNGHTFTAASDVQLNLSPGHVAGGGVAQGHGIFNNRVRRNASRPDGLMFVQMIPFPATGGGASGPSFRSSGAIGGTGNVSSFTVDYPSGIQADDILYLHISSRDDLGNADVSSISDGGFALVQTVFTGGTVDTISKLYWKRATGSESGTLTVTLTEAVTNAIAAGVMSAWSGCLTSGT
jgi:hypothetical protein